MKLGTILALALAVDAPVPPVAPEAPAPSVPAAPALRDELRAAAKARSDERAQIDRERRELAAERARLEKLAKEIEAARAALRDETARLEAALARKPADAPPAPVPEAPPRSEVVAERVDTLARALRGMRPEQAALVAARLDEPLAVRVLARMRPADGGAVLARMEPARAATLLDALARLPREEARP